MSPTVRRTSGRGEAVAVGAQACVDRGAVENAVCAWPQPPTSGPIPPPHSRFRSSFPTFHFPASPTPFSVFHNNSAPDNLRLVLLRNTPGDNTNTHTNTTRGTGTTLPALSWHFLMPPLGAAAAPAAVRLNASGRVRHAWPPLEPAPLGSCDFCHKQVWGQLEGWTWVEGAQGRCSTACNPFSLLPLRPPPACSFLVLSWAPQLCTSTPLQLSVLSRRLSRFLGKVAAASGGGGSASGGGGSGRSSDSKAAPAAALPDMLFLVNAADNMQRFGRSSRAPLLSLIVSRGRVVGWVGG